MKRLSLILFLLAAMAMPLHAQEVESDEVDDAPAEEMMEGFLKEMRKAHPDQMPIQNADPLLVVGTPVTRIIEIADKKNAGMIILGSHGRTGLSHLLIGSKAERVVQLSPIPVTVVKASKKTEKLFTSI